MITISQENKRIIFLFCIFLILGSCLAITAYSDHSILRLNFLWRDPFRLLIKISCAAAFFILFFRIFTSRLLFRKALKPVFGVIFLPLVLLPAFRCWFKVPYIFCGVCPAQCPWGISRTFVFNTAILLNLSGRFWCGNLCPLGTFQECQASISKQSVKLPSWTNLSAYAILFLFFTMYYLAFSGSRALAFFETGRYGWVVTTASIALLTLLAAFFIPRIWCRYACPVGTIAKITSGLLRFIKGNPPKTK
jgi:polyferredoxin